MLERTQAFYRFKCQSFTALLCPSPPSSVVLFVEGIFAPGGEALQTSGLCGVGGSPQFFPFVITHDFIQKEENDVCMFLCECEGQETTMAAIT